MEIQSDPAFNESLRFVFGDFTAEITTNQTGGFEQEVLERTTLNTDFTVIFLTCLELLVASMGLFFILLVFSVLVQISHKELRSKSLLINALVADGLSVVSRICEKAIVYIAITFGMTGKYEHLCFSRIAGVCTCISQLAQSFSALLLVCDRMYAIVCPLGYRFEHLRYSRLVSVLIAIVTWLLSIGISVPVFMLASDVTEGAHICERMAVSLLHLNRAVRFPVTIAVHCLVFICYAILFFIIKCRRPPACSSRKSNRTLSLTFFAVHLSSLCLFVPGPLFAIILRSYGITLQPVTLVKIGRAMVILYMLNTIIDPLIMASRIPAIKHRLLSLYRNKRSS